jgi:hypothetical protein
MNNVDKNEVLVSLYSDGSIEVQVGEDVSKEIVKNIRIEFMSKGLLEVERPNNHKRLFQYRKPGDFLQKNRVLISNKRFRVDSITPMNIEKSAEQFAIDNLIKKLNIRTVNQDTASEQTQQIFSPLTSWVKTPHTAKGWHYSQEDVDYWSNIQVDPKYYEAD